MNYVPIILYVSSFMIFILTTFKCYFADKLVKNYEELVESKDQLIETQKNIVIKQDELITILKDRLKMVEK